MSSVSNFYKDKTIFITGGTGFLGVALIEKLLRACPGIKNIYLLMRPKKGKEIKERLEELKKNSVFTRLKEENKTDLLEKLIPVAGDVGEENLGLSSADRLTLVEVVHIVFHSAATLDFEADLKSAGTINLLGTRRVVELCQEIRDLKALVHISSAYVNSNLKSVEEKVYPPAVDPKNILKLIAEKDTEKFITESAELLKSSGHPNSYTITKQLAEHEVVKGHVPAAIIRPSMITGAWKEPMPGWTISKNGPHGFLVGASKGVVRRLPVAVDLIYDYIPVDIVVNSIIAAAHAVDSAEDVSRTREVKIYHCTSSTSNPFRWENIEHRINSYLHQYPIPSAVWYPHLKLSPSLFMFRISALFVHMFPAYILDTVTKLAGGRPILVRLHTNINKSLVRLEKFIFTEWKFQNQRLRQLHESLSEDDKEVFSMDIKTLDWPDYFSNLTLGVRTYLQNESPKTLEKSRRKDKILMCVHLGLQAAFLGVLWWLCKSMLATTWLKSSFIVVLTYFIMEQI